MVPAKSHAIRDICTMTLCSMKISTVHKRIGYNTGSEDTEARRAVGAEGVLHERGPICVRTDVSWRDGQVVT